jgi:hypothetical protein
MSSPKCRSVEVINNPARTGSNHKLLCTCKKRIKRRKEKKTKQNRRKEKKTKQNKRKETKVR